MYITTKTIARKSYYIDMFCLINVEDIHHKAAKQYSAFMFHSETPKTPQCVCVSYLVFNLYLNIRYYAGPPIIIFI